MGRKGRRKKKTQQVKESQFLSPQGRSQAASFALFACEEWSLLCGGREGGLGSVKQRKRVEIQVEGMLAARRLLFGSLMNSDKPRSTLPPLLIEPETLAPQREGVAFKEQWESRLVVARRYLLRPRPARLQ